MPVGNAGKHYISARAQAHVHLTRTARLAAGIADALHCSPCPARTPKTNACLHTHIHTHTHTLLPPHVDRLFIGQTETGRQTDTHTHTHTTLLPHAHTTGNTRTHTPRARIPLLRLHVDRLTVSEPRDRLRLRQRVHVARDPSHLPVARVLLPVAADLGRTYRGQHGKVSTTGGSSGVSTTRRHLPHCNRRCRRKFIPRQSLPPRIFLLKSVSKSLPSLQPVNLFPPQEKRTTFV